MKRFFAYLFILLGSIGIISLIIGYSRFSSSEGYTEFSWFINSRGFAIGSILSIFLVIGLFMFNSMRKGKKEKIQKLEERISQLEK